MSVFQKRMRRGPYPNCRDCLDMGFNYPDEGPSSRWCIEDPGIQKEAEIDLTSESEEEEDEDMIEEHEGIVREEDDEDVEEDNEEDEEDEEDNDDGSWNIDDFYQQIVGDPTYSPRNRALSEWDAGFWKGSRHLG